MLPLQACSADNRRPRQGTADKAIVVGQQQGSPKVPAHGAAAHAGRDTTVQLNLPVLHASAESVSRKERGNRLYRVTFCATASLLTAARVLVSSATCADSRANTWPMTLGSQQPISCDMQRCQVSDNSTRGLWSVNIRCWPDTARVRRKVLDGNAFPTKRLTAMSPGLGDNADGDSLSQQTQLQHLRGHAHNMRRQYCNRQHKRAFT